MAYNLYFQKKRRFDFFEKFIQFSKYLSIIGSEVMDNGEIYTEPRKQQTVVQTNR